MSKAKLGDHISLDVGRLIETRMLVQANSGGGKSWAIRKLLEETHGKAQQIVLDMEGEFATLRESYDYILAGKGGDVDANPKTAEILARKVLELEVSLIVDLFELKKPMRKLFVKNFLEAMLDAPRDLWHPVIVVVDEAHIYAPEKGESVAAEAVADLATRGRKRGFAAVIATQRLAKLNKDVAAECLNKMIGRTSLDIDRKRAGDELGFLNAKDSLVLRKLKPGDFYAFGPAISDDVVLGRIGAVQTTHPKAGQRLGFKRIKPTAAIKSVLKKLTDLPKEAETELKDRDAMKARIKELERELRVKPKVITATETIVKTKKVSKAELKRAQLKVKAEMLRVLADAFHDVKVKLQDAFSKAVIEPYLEDDETKVTAAPIDVHKSIRAAVQRRMAPLRAIKASEEVQPKELDRPSSELGACERKILGFLSMKAGQAFTKIQVGAMTGYRPGSGGFNNSLSKLKQAGLITRDHGGLIALAPDADVSEMIDTVPHRLEDWVNKLPTCERKIFEFLLENPSTEFPKEEVGSQTGYQPSSGGFNNALSKLNTLGLIRRQHGGRVQLNPEVQGLT